MIHYTTWRLIDDLSFTYVSGTSLIKDIHVLDLRCALTLTADRPNDRVFPPGTTPLVFVCSMAPPHRLELWTSRLTVRRWWTTTCDAEVDTTGCWLLMAGRLEYPDSADPLRSITPLLTNFDTSHDGGIYWSAREAPDRTDSEAQCWGETEKPETRHLQPRTSWAQW